MPRHRWKCQDYNTLCRGKADFVTVRSFHLYGKSKGYTPLLPQLPELASLQCRDELRRTVKGFQINGYTLLI
jgi:hypothetical protein